VVVLCYHRLEGKAGGAYSIEPALFEKHMQELKDMGIGVISMQDLLQWRAGKKNIPPKAAMITIDDGYASGMEVGLPILKKYGFAWVTLGFLAVSLVGHWVFGWFAFVDEQTDIGAPITAGAYLIIMLRDTFENWQSEFLQLLWQVVGLTILLYVGSPQSKESEDRTEEILKAILRSVDPKGAEQKLDELDRKYPTE
jgi:hypothetical protein